MACVAVAQFCCSFNISAYPFFFFFPEESSYEIPFSFWSVKYICFIYVCLLLLETEVNLIEHKLKILKDMEHLLP
jgi:hypothetical protein